ncbi:TetR/AcrR family transcriptional regulator [Mycolicibacterium komossense]|uniref:TetR/AcrR family transcriptional regulator n=1 Tax=Mycolicibacterium komossense TaxID=1779 RepID=A0ABT3C653_9MYCO|nr:TetR/AcrR family transcriptional regulator [Mycolicibacterium komossense]MCV7224952.1 TetR/AcrR family transcriptional regulator [Mycolicibacterium komossense]
MLSISNAPEIGDRILAAAASCVVDFGVDRVTLAEIARRARVSRPTIYRRFPDTQSILTALLTSRVVAVLDEVPQTGADRAAIVDRVIGVAARLRDDEIIMAVLHSAPELAMTYIAERLGSSQQILIDALAADLAVAQAGGSVRAGDPGQLAAMVLLIVQSSVQSARIIEKILPVEVLAAELRHAVNGYLI